jgi:outer membrane protein assembly factor BamB
MRRPILSWFILSLAFASLASHAADWPQFLGPDRTGVSPEKGLARTWPADGPKVLWTAKLGLGYGGAAVEGGKVYVLDRDGNKQDVFRCYDLATGKEEWNCAFDAPGDISHPGSRSTPAVDDKYVFGIGPFGGCYAVDKATHKAVWQQNLLKDYGGELPRWAVSQSPLLCGDVVIVAPASKTVGLLACEKATGRPRWKSEPVGTMSFASPIPATVGGVAQIVLLTYDGVAGVDPRDGKVLWKHAWPSKHPIANPCAFGEGRFLLVNGYGGGCLGIQVLAQDWKFATKELFKNMNLAAQITTPIWYDGHFLAVDNNNDVRRGLSCLTPSGEAKWRTGRAPNFERGNFLLADGLLFIMDGENGTLYMAEASAAGYKELAKAKVLTAVDKEVWAPLALSDGRLLVRDQHEMKCLDVRGK